MNKKYSENKILRFLNALSEFALLVLAFLIANLLRLLLPFGEWFYFEDFRRFLPLSVVYGVLIVFCYYGIGAYRSVRVSSRKKLLMQIVVVQVLSIGYLMGFVYSLKMTQFSRLLSAYYLVVSIVCLFGKRILCDYIASVWRKSKDITTSAILIGSGAIAEYVFDESFAEPNQFVNFGGYISEHENPAMRGYLGGMNKLIELLRAEGNDIRMLIYAEDEQNAADLKYLSALAIDFGVELTCAPVYSKDFNGIGKTQYLGKTLLVEIKPFDHCSIMDVEVAVTDMKSTMRLIDKNLEEWRGHYICVANVHTTVTAHNDPDYLAIQNGAVMVLPDGGPLSTFSRSHGHSMAERVTGPDLMQELLRSSDKKNYRHFFYGSTEETLEKLKAKLEREYPDAIVAGMYSPPFRVVSAEEDEEIIRMINDAKPDFVWVGLGAPKQERWMAAHENKIDALMVGVGAAFDYEAGNIKRAPKWMQKMNLEWLYRLIQDPSRLFMRYFTTNLRYLWWALWH